MSSSSALMAPMLPAIRSRPDSCYAEAGGGLQAAAARAVPGAWLPLAILTDTR